MRDLHYSEQAVKQIKSLAKSDRASAKVILSKIEQYALDPTSVVDIKKLKGKFASFKRMRAGDYRIILDEEANIIFIYQIRHRREVYK